MKGDTVKQKKNDSCGVCAHPEFARVQYHDGDMLTARDLCDEQSYQNEKRWLLNRMITGCGVVCGLDIRHTKKGCFEITEGLALDCHGHEILVCGDVDPWQLTTWDIDGYDRKKPWLKGREYEVCLRYDAKPHDCGNADDKCGGKKKAKSADRLVDGWRITLRELKPRKDTPKHCRDPLCPLTAMRARGACGETIQKYLCDELRKPCCPCAAGCCVVLGTVVVVPWEWGSKKTRPPKQALKQRKGKGNRPRRPGPYEGALRVLKVRPCKGRQIVYTNQVLRDLVHSYHGDLPRICKINKEWAEWHNQSWVPYKADGEQSNEPPDAMPWKTLRKCLRRGFSIYFDRPMNWKTIHRMSFQVAVYSIDGETAQWNREYIPYGWITYDKRKRSATFRVLDPDTYGAYEETDWWHDVIDGKSNCAVQGGWIEITVRGSMIRDRNGQALDGEPLGFPTGNGTQGGDFVSVFPFKKRPKPKSVKKKRGKRRRY